MDPEIFPFEHGYGQTIVPQWLARLGESRRRIPDRDEYIPGPGLKIPQIHLIRVKFQYHNTHLCFHSSSCFQLSVKKEEGAGDFLPIDRQLKRYAEEVSVGY